MTFETQSPQSGGLAELGAPVGIGDERRTSTDSRRIRHSQPKVNNWTRDGSSDFAIGQGHFTVSTI